MSLGVKTDEGTAVYSTFHKLAGAQIKTADERDNLLRTIGKVDGIEELFGVGLLLALTPEEWNKAVRQLQDEADAEDA